MVTKLTINKTEEGKWNPEKVGEIYAGLKEGLNGMELANLTERLLADKMFNQKCINIFQEYLAPVQKDKPKTEKTKNRKLHEVFQGVDSRWKVKETTGLMSFRLRGDAEEYAKEARLKAAQTKKVKKT